MFIFKWIRTIKTKEWDKNIKIIWYTTSNEEQVKQLFWYYSIVILSFSSFEENILGKKYEIWIKHDENKINIIISLDDETKIKEAYSYFLEHFWIKNIEYIKPYWLEISEEKQKLILEKLRKENEQKNNKGIWKNTIKNGKDVVDFDKNKIKELVTDIDDFIKDANDLIKDANNLVPTLSYDLQNKINDLVKYKKTTNIYKIASIYKEALEIYDKLYNKYFDLLKAKEEKENTENIISEIDIIREYKNYEKVQRAKHIEKVDTKEFAYPFYEVLYYKLFWKFWINLKLLITEFIKKYHLNYYSFDDIFNFLQLLFVFLIVDYSILLIYNLLTENSLDSQLAIFYIILNFSLYWFIITIWKFIAKKNIIVSIVVMILLIIFSYYFKKYFAL